MLSNIVLKSLNWQGETSFLIHNKFMQIRKKKLWLEMNGCTKFSSSSSFKVHQDFIAIY